MGDLGRIGKIAVVTLSARASNVLAEMRPLGIGRDRTRNHKRHIGKSDDLLRNGAGQATWRYENEYIKYGDCDDYSPRWLSKPSPPVMHNQHGGRWLFKQ
jgi:hypothetical protein